MNQFRRPKIKVLLGPDVHLYHPSDGGTAIYLPLIVSNKSPTKGVVAEIYLRINKVGTNKYYFMKWWEEANVTIRDFQYNHMDRAKAFTIDGYATVSKVYWFLWPENPANKLFFEEGKYVFAVILRNDKSNKFNIEFSEELDVSKELEIILKERYQNKVSTTQFLYFNSKSLIAALGETKDLSEILANKK